MKAKFNYLSKTLGVVVAIALQSTIVGATTFAGESNATSVGGETPAVTTPSTSTKGNGGETPAVTTPSVTAEKGNGGETPVVTTPSTSTPEKGNVTIKFIYQECIDDHDYSIAVNGGTPVQLSNFFDAKSRTYILADVEVGSTINLYSAVEGRVVYSFNVEDFSTSHSLAVANLHTFLFLPDDGFGVDLESVECSINGEVPVSLSSLKTASGDYTIPKVLGNSVKLDFYQDGIKIGSNEITKNGDNICQLKIPSEHLFECNFRIQNVDAKDIWFYIQPLKKAASVQLHKLSDYQYNGHYAIPISNPSAENSIVFVNSNDAVLATATVSPENFNTLPTFEIAEKSFSVNLHGDLYGHIADDYKKVTFSIDGGKQKKITDYPLSGEIFTIRDDSLAKGSKITFYYDGKEVDTVTLQALGSLEHVNLPTFTTVYEFAAAFGEGTSMDKLQFSVDGGELQNAADFLLVDKPNHIAVIAPPKADIQFYYDGEQIDTPEVNLESDVYDLVVGDAKPTESVYLTITAPEDYDIADVMFTMNDSDKRPLKVYKVPGTSMYKVDGLDFSNPVTLKFYVDDAIVGAVTLDEAENMSITLGTPGSVEEPEEETPSKKPGESEETPSTTPSKKPGETEGTSSSTSTEGSPSKETEGTASSISTEETPSKTGDVSPLGFLLPMSAAFLGIFGLGKKREKH